MNFKNLTNIRFKKVFFGFGVVVVVFVVYFLLFYTEFKNGNLTITLRSRTLLNQNGYCFKEDRTLEVRELFERATKDFFRKSYDLAHKPRYYNTMQEEWQTDEYCWTENKEWERKQQKCQFWSNGKQFDINDVIGMINYDKNVGENIESLKHKLRIKRPFEEEQFLTEDLNLKYSVFFEYTRSFYFIPYDIEFINIGDATFPSKFGYSAYALMVKKYHLSAKSNFSKFSEDDFKHYYYEYYPITNCGEVEIRNDDGFKLLDGLNGG